MEDTLAGYQQAATTFAVYPGQGENMGLLYETLALSAETGEFSKRIKAIMQNGPSVDSQDSLIEQLGVLLWHTSQLCTEVGVSLADVAELNLDRLRSRFDEGTLRD